ALVFIPLLLALTVLAAPTPLGLRALGARLVLVLRPMLVGLAVAAVVIFGWDVLRRPPIGFWAQGYFDNLPGRLVRATEVLPRALAWVNLQHYCTGSTLVNILFLLGLPFLLLAGRQAATRAALFDFLLVTYPMLYLGVYWLFAFNVWDRYLLPVLQLWLLLMARVAELAGGLVTRGLQRWRLLRAPPSVGRQAVAVALVLLIFPASLQAARSINPIGGDHGAYDGVDGAAQYLRQLPYGTVLYDH